MGWVIWLVAFLIIIAILWLVCGGRNYEFVGLRPLHPSESILEYIQQNDIPISYPPPDLPYNQEKEIMEEEKNNQEKENISFKPQEEVSEICQEVCQEDKALPEIIDVTPQLPAPFSNIITLEQNSHVYRSKGEHICCKVMEEIYGKPFRRARPAFLKNPETGHPLELDCYNEELKMAVEYNGKQHYVYPNHINMTHEDFLKQIQRDQFKVNQCDQFGIYLITVPYNVPHPKIKEYITYYLPENVIQRQQV